MDSKFEHITTTWREIVYPTGKTISQDKRYSPVFNFRIAPSTSS